MTRHLTGGVDEAEAGLKQVHRQVPPPAVSKLTRALQLEPGQAAVFFVARTKWKELVLLLPSFRYF